MPLCGVMVEKLIDHSAVFGNRLMDGLSPSLFLPSLPVFSAIWNMLVGTWSALLEFRYLVWAVSVHFLVDIGIGFLLVLTVLCILALCQDRLTRHQCHTSVSTSHHRHSSSSHNYHDPLRAARLGVLGVETFPSHTSAPSPPGVSRLGALESGGSSPEGTTRKLVAATRTAERRCGSGCEIPPHRAKKWWFGEHKALLPGVRPDALSKLGTQEAVCRAGTRAGGAPMLLTLVLGAELVNASLLSLFGVLGFSSGPLSVINPVGGWLAASWNRIVGSQVPVDLFPLPLLAVARIPRVDGQVSTFPFRQPLESTGWSGVDGLHSLACSALSGVDASSSIATLGSASAGDSISAGSGIISVCLSRWSLRGVSQRKETCDGKVAEQILSQPGLSQYDHVWVKIIPAGKRKPGNLMGIMNRCGGAQMNCSWAWSWAP